MPLRQRLLTAAGLAAAAGIPAALLLAYRRRRHPGLALAAGACLLAEAADGVRWYRIAYAPEEGDSPGDDDCDSGNPPDAPAS